MASDDRITVSSIADEIAFRLEAEILDGGYAPGSHLMQEEVCARYGISRTPVREALRKLQAQNLVDLIPNKGARVRTLTLSDLRELYAVRGELEAYAASLAAESFTAEHVTDLKRSQTELEAVVATVRIPSTRKDGDALINAQVTRCNEDFHRIIRQAAGNTLLDRMISDLQRRFPKDYIWKAFESQEQLREINVKEHRAIQRALTRNDSAAARAAMMTHVSHSAEILLGHLTMRGTVR